MSKDNIYFPKNGDKNTNTVYDKALNYINLHYQLSHNIVSMKTMIKPLNKKSDKWEVLNHNSLLIELERKDIKIPENKLFTLLKSTFIDQKNPFKDYFKQLDAWDGNDYIEEISKYLPMIYVEDFKTQLKKWLVRTVKCALEDGYVNKHCIVLVHKGQNSGKTTFCRWLVPPALREYKAENIDTNKDSKINLTRSFLIILDDMDKQKSSNIGAYKSMISLDFVYDRLPYDRVNSHLPRRATFIGNTNETSFLIDETGNVRWICFELIDQINFSYSKEIDINKVWAQAYHLAYSTQYQCELTKDDIIKNEERNKKFRELSIEEELLIRFFERSQNKADFMTAFDVCMSLKKDYPNLSLSKVRMGKALSQFTHKVRNSESLHGYLVKKVSKH